MSDVAVASEPVRFPAVCKSIVASVPCIWADRDAEGSLLSMLAAVSAQAKAYCSEIAKRSYRDLHIAHQSRSSGQHKVGRRRTTT